jgi:hypothetical protein
MTITPPRPMIMRLSNVASDHGTAKRAGVGAVAVHRPNPLGIEVSAQKAPGADQMDIPDGGPAANYLACN